MANSGRLASSETDAATPATGSVNRALGRDMKADVAKSLFVRFALHFLQRTPALAELYALAEDDLVQSWAETWAVNAPCLVERATRLRAEPTFEPLESRIVREYFYSPYPTEWEHEVAQFDALPLDSAALAPLTADPLFETAREFLDQAKEHYEARKRRMEDLGLSTVRTPWDVRRHSVWLIRFQLGRESYSAIARTDHAAEPAVRKAVGDLAQLIGLPLRKGQPGRPKTSTSR